MIETNQSLEKSSKCPTINPKLRYRYRFHNQLGLMVLSRPRPSNIFAKYKIDRNRSFI